MKWEEALMGWMDSQGWLDSLAKKIQPLVSSFYQSLGSLGQPAADFLNGTWLGHPLHSVLTDIPTGAYTVGAMLDTFEMATGDESLSAGADGAIALGVAGAVGSAVSGLTDWQHTVGKSRRVGMAHALLNVTALGCYLLSLAARKGKNRQAGWGFAFLGFGITSAAAYLGGHLVFSEKIGVNHAPEPEDLPKDFTPAMPAADLPDGTLHKAMVNNVPVLLVRRGSRIYALAEVCSHLGGPLSEGELCDDDSVICPWHSSRFALEDGSPLTGPTTYPQPSLETRVREGQIEVRMSPNQHL